MSEVNDKSVIGGNARVTMSSVAGEAGSNLDWKRQLADYGRRRHLSYTMDFDARVYAFDDPGDGWSDDVKRLHLEGRKRTEAALVAEFGELDAEKKIENFILIGEKPFSILAYHNEYFDQVRRAFVIGAYYPALVGACALGERILNHLVLDLRDCYKSTAEYQKVFRKHSFDNWELMVSTLESWGVLLPGAAAELRALMRLRHRSIHFNFETYSTLKEDALAAVLHLKEVIGQQFTSFGDRPWFIRGTRGQVFIKREWEDHPFIKTYYLPTCPFVGPYFAISFEGGLSFHDFDDYGDGSWSDEEYAAAFEAREPSQLPNVG